MDNQTNIERTVMRRVHLIRILQLVIGAGVFATLAFVAALWGVGREVWVAHVFQNAPTGIGPLVTFYVAAFLHTRLIVQVLVTLTLLSLLFLAREVVRFALTLAAPARA